MTAPTDALPCNPAIPLGCVLDLPGKAAEAVAGNAFESMVRSIMESAVTVLQKLSTFWLSVPDPTVTDGSVNASTVSTVGLAGPLEYLTSQLQVYLVGLTLATILIQCLLMVFKMSGEPLVGIGYQLLMIVMVQGTLGAVVQLALGISDRASKVMLDLPGLSDQGFGALLSINDAMGAQALGLWLVLGLLSIFGSLMQFVFMLFRSPLIILLLLAMHAAAAVAASKSGQQRLARAAGLMTSFILYKAVAAVIYATGFMLIYGVDGQDGWKGTDPTLNAIYGFVIILLAALALPAVIKFVDAGAGATGSAMFSGGALAGALAAGAVAVGTAGAGAAAGPSAAGGAAKTGAGGASASGPGGAGSGTGGIDPSTGGDGAAGSGGGGASIGDGAGGTSNAQDNDGSGSGSGSSASPAEGAGTEGGSGGTGTEEAAGADAAGNDASATGSGAGATGVPGSASTVEGGESGAAPAPGSAPTGSSGQGEASPGSGTGSDPSGSTPAAGAVPEAGAGSSAGGSAAPESGRAARSGLPAWARGAKTAGDVAARANRAVDDSMTAEGTA